MSEFFSRLGCLCSYPWTPRQAHGCGAENRVDDARFLLMGLFRSVGTQQKLVDIAFDLPTEHQKVG